MCSLNTLPEDLRLYVPLFCSVITKWVNLNALRSAGGGGWLGMKNRLVFVWPGWAVELWTTGSRPSRWSWGREACLSPPRSSLTPPSWTCLSRSASRVCMSVSVSVCVWLMSYRKLNVHSPICCDRQGVLLSSSSLERNLPHMFQLWSDIFNRCVLRRHHLTPQSSLAHVEPVL